MNAEDFIAHLEKSLADKTPFVAYRKGTSTEATQYTLQSFFQQDRQVYTTTDYAASGFVMTPFDETVSKPLLIPADKATQITAVLKKELLPEAPIPQKLQPKYTLKEEHLNLVKKGVQAITAGQFKKVVLSQKFSINTNQKPIAIFQRLLKKYPAAFVYCWFHPKIGLWLGATPETLVKITGHNLKTMALAGTKPMVLNQLPHWTPKEKKEQQYVTTYIKQILTQYSPYITVNGPTDVQAGKLWHLKSTLSTRLTAKEDAAKIIQALHPTPAVCGLPKNEAKNFILNHENYNRTFYTGFLGELNIEEKNIRKANRRSIEQQAYTQQQKQTELFVNLRCMQLKENNAIIYAGGGIVQDSDPENEWEEIVNKSQTMAAVL